jgi:hypothetical protein
VARLLASLAYEHVTVDIEQEPVPRGRWKGMSWREGGTTNFQGSGGVPLPIKCLR